MSTDSPSVQDRELRVGMVGYAFMGAAHSTAWRTVNSAFDLSARARMALICGRDESKVAGAAAKLGWDAHTTDWREVVERDDIDIVDVCTPGDSHAEIAIAALAAGKHVLCEKPLAPTVSDAQAMVEAAAAHPDQVDAVGFTFRRSPAINALKEQVEQQLGRVRHFIGDYWCDYGFDPNRPMSWRYQGGPGSGVLADIGSHMVDLAEFFCGDTVAVQGTTMATLITERPRPLGVAMGHAGGVQVSDERVPVENEDVCTFTTSYANGAVGTIALSRVAYGHANSLRFHLFCEGGTASFDLTRPAEFSIIDGAPAEPVNGARTVFIGPWHPYLARGLPMDFPTVGHGQNDFFVYQAKAFLDQIASVQEIPPCPDMAHGLHNLKVLEAVAAATDKPVTV